MVPKYLGPEEFGYGGVIGVSLFCFLFKMIGSSLVSELFKYKSSTFVQNFTRFQLARPRRAVPQR